MSVTRYAVPDSAEKKVITETYDITELYTMFSEIEVSNKKTEHVAGGDVISFRFNLSDDTSYEIIYCVEAVKAGRLKLPMEQVDYFTSADIEGYWNVYEEDNAETKPHLDKVNHTPKFQVHADFLDAWMVREPIADDELTVPGEFYTPPLSFANGISPLAISGLTCLSPMLEKSHRNNIIRPFILL